MTATEFDPILALDNPYPGLRSFETHESVLFFGREEHTRELLDRLALNRFLAVIGTSGSGKSSLVRAGLLPVLHRGYLVGTGSRWRIAIMRPGSAPLHAMTQALASEDVLGVRDAAELRKTLESSSYGLVKAVRAARLRTGESLLLVVDQFEELFRFARDSRHPGTGAEAALFVSLLIQAAEEFNEPIYIVLTMRSEFLGDCTQFPGLAEALNRSQYLIPRLTLDQRQAAVERPLALATAEIAPRLVQRLLTDAGDDPDQLPVLQHALMRTYRHWRNEGERGPLDLKDYEDVSRSGSALDDHAQEIYTSLPAETQLWAERLFRCLTTTLDGRAVRRPGRLRWIYAVTGARTAAERNHINAAIRAYAARENSLLFCTTGAELTPRSVIDIAHESLIRKWTMLRQWVSAEAKNADWFRDVANTVARGAALMEGSDLVHVEQLAAENRWNSAWAAQYKPKREVRFSRVVEFLRASREEQEECDRKEEERRNRELRTAQELAKGEQEKRKLLEQRRRMGYLLIGLMALAVIGLAGLASSFYREREIANQQREVANRASQSAQAAENRAKAAESLANVQAVELQLLKATGAEREQLQKERDEYKKQAEQYTKNASNIKTDPNDASAERIRTLQADVDRLQERLRQRDLLLYQKSDSPQQQQQQQQQQQKGDAEAIAALRSQVQGLQGEIARLRSAPPPVVTTENAPTFHPLVVPESSWQLYPAASPKFGILLDDLKRDADTARMMVFALPSSYAPPGGPISNRDRVVKAKIDELSARHPCPSPPAIAGDVACFLVSKKQTNGEGQLLGTVAIGQTAFAFHALAWRNAPIGTDVLSVAVIAAGKADASRAQKVETIAEVDLSTDGTRVVKLTGTDSYLYVGGLSTDNLLTLMAISTKSPWWPAGGKPDSRQEVEKKLKRAAGPQLGTEEYHSCQIRENETCWITLPTGQVVGAKAVDLAYVSSRVKLSLQRVRP